MELYERSLSCIATAQKDRKKKMPEMHIDRKMNRCDFKYLYFDKVASCN